MRCEIMDRMRVVGSEIMLSYELRVERGYARICCMALPVGCWCGLGFRGRARRVLVPKSYCWPTVLRL
jgi:hypothetical protein